MLIGVQASEAKRTMKLARISSYLRSSAEKNPPSTGLGDCLRGAENDVGFRAGRKAMKVQFLFECGF